MAVQSNMRPEGWTALIYGMEGNVRENGYSMEDSLS